MSLKIYKRKNLFGICSIICVIILFSSCYNNNLNKNAKRNNIEMPHPKSLYYRVYEKWYDKHPNSLLVDIEKIDELIELTKKLDFEKIKENLKDYEKVFNGTPLGKLEISRIILETLNHDSLYARIKCKIIDEYKMDKDILFTFKGLESFCKKVLTIFRSLGEWYNFDCLISDIILNSITEYLVTTKDKNPNIKIKSFLLDTIKHKNKNIRSFILCGMERITIWGGNKTLTKKIRITICGGNETLTKKIKKDFKQILVSLK